MRIFQSVTLRQRNNNTKLLQHTSVCPCSRAGVYISTFVLAAVVSPSFTCFLRNGRRLAIRSFADRFHSVCLVFYFFSSGCDGIVSSRSRNTSFFFYNAQIVCLLLFFSGYLLQLTICLLILSTILQFHRTCKHCKYLL